MTLRAANIFGSATSAIVGATIARRRHDERIERGKPPVHGAHQTLARVKHLDVVRRRYGAAALDARADVRIDIGGAPFEPVAMDSASLGLHDAAIGIDLPHLVEQRQLFARDRARRRRRSRSIAAAKAAATGVVQFSSGKPFARHRSEGRQAAPASSGAKSSPANDRVGFGAVGDAARQRPDRIERGAQWKSARRSGCAGGSA